MDVSFVISGPDSSNATLLLAHGAGAPMDSASMNAVAEALAAEGIRVARFEFSYMAARRSGGSRKPPPRADRLKGEYLDAVRTLRQNGPLVIGGKSMGGRVASMVADELYEDGKIAGVVCFGYPFHPPSKPDLLRTAHLENLVTPTLIFQGTRDPFGTIHEVPSYSLSKAIELVWLEDGDHDLKPRKRVAGLTVADHLKTMAQRASSWIANLL